MTSTNTLPPQSAAPAPANVLRIVAGLHAGASRIMAEQEMILVGSGEDCDIVLADAGVASHHALISLVGGRFSLRALDAPLHVGTSLVHPGDPVELSAVQRVGLGDAALAFGAENDPRWHDLLPAAAVGAMPTARPSSPSRRVLPAIAALAALSLASVAIFAAVAPPAQKAPEPQVVLSETIARFGVDNGRVETDVEGKPVLSGTVADLATSERIRQYLVERDVEATLRFRTGEKIAEDVREALRTQGLVAKTRYLGNGDVEVAGRFEDEAALRSAALSRAMQDIAGVNRVIPRNYADPQDVKPAAQPSAAAPAPTAVQIVSVVRGGNEPHVVAADGRKFPVGDDIPGKGTLISIGEHAHVLAPDGQLLKIKPEPVKPPADPAQFANVQTGSAAPQRQ